MWRDLPRTCRLDPTTGYGVGIAPLELMIQDTSRHQVVAAEDMRRVGVKRVAAE